MRGLLWIRTLFVVLIYLQRKSINADAGNDAAIKCSSLPDPLNGKKTGCTNMKSKPYDTRCNFSCNVGYSLVGSPIRSCQENGSWSGEKSHCQAINCSSLPDPLNGSKTGCTNITSEPFDTRCKFSCNVGYSLVGSPIRRCLENGNWSGEKSHCQGKD